MRKTSLLTLTIAALLICSASVAFAAAQDSVDGATPDPSNVPLPNENTTHESVKDFADGNVSSDNATIAPDDQQYNILDDNSSAPLIAPGPQGNGEELMYAAGAAEDNSNSIIAIVGIIIAAVAIAGATIGLVYRHKTYKTL